MSVTKIGDFCESDMPQFMEEMFKIDQMRKSTILNQVVNPTTHNIDPGKPAAEVSQT